MTAGPEQGDGISASRVRYVHILQASHMHEALRILTGALFLFLLYNAVGSVTHTESL
jgi:hypothetical protein